MFKKLSVVALSSLISLPAMATNFSYSTIDISVGNKSLNEPVTVGTSGLFRYELKSASKLGFGGAWQFHEHGFIGANRTSYSAESEDESASVNAYDLSFYIGGVFAVNDSMDLGVTLGRASSSYEAKTSNSNTKQNKIVLAIQYLHASKQ